MSIQLEIAARLQEGRLVPLVPLFSSGASLRTLLVVPSLLAAMDGTTNDEEENRRFGQTRALLESFVEGAEIVVRLPPGKSVKCLLALLDPLAENAWEFRIGFPRPGIRIFGRFAEKDLFVATHWCPREQLWNSKTGKEDPKKWNAEMLRCGTEWRKLFPAYPPLTGEHLHDYLSQARLPV